MIEVNKLDASLGQFQEFLREIGGVTGWVGFPKIKIKNWVMR